ncbi:hypothetical protein MYX07_01675, partial [Patescibacteria group bacterium AH-259-L07]|nr:hypothetical protein [Patescibacteria group bacterium AH-259-L07]
MKESTAVTLFVILFVAVAFLGLATRAQYVELDATKSQKNQHQAWLIRLQNDVQKLGNKDRGREYHLALSNETIDSLMTVISGDGYESLVNALSALQ